MSILTIVVAAIATVVLVWLCREGKFPAPVPLIIYIVLAVVWLWLILTLLGVPLGYRIS